jgi:hypothetical protein
VLQFFIDIHSKVSNGWSWRRAEETDSSASTVCEALAMIDPTSKAGRNSGRPPNKAEIPDL